MILVLLFNLVLVVAAVLLSNDTLARYSWILYGLQSLSLLPAVLRRARFASNLFLPSFFTLVYYSANLTFGSFLVPRDFGFYKDYTWRALTMQTYHQIVPYLLLCNIVLFAVSIATLSRPELDERRRSDALDSESGVRAVGQAVLFAGFLACSYLDFTGAFSLQLAMLVVHVGSLSRRQPRYRWGIYLAYLLVEVGLNFNNKREVVIVLFLILFYESYGQRVRLKLSIANLVRYAGAGVGFVGLILTASVLRGYGDFAPASVFGAIRVLPNYIRAPIFWDALIENFELNYNYGASITAIDFAIRGKLEYLLGLSFWKVLFLPIPRGMIGWKPESVMQLYTKAYSLGFWQENGSLPVVFSSEMFVNFGHFGLLPFALVWIGLNRIFVSFRTARPHSFWYHSSAFLCVTTLVFARGSGIELYLLTYLLAVPVFIAVGIARSWYPAQ